MTFIATTTATFMRGSTEDEFGDEVDSNEPYTESIPVAITQKQMRVFLPDTNEYRTVRQYVGRVNVQVAVQKGDRLKDDRSGQVYLVDEVTYSTSLAQTQGCILDLRSV